MSSSVTFETMCAMFQEDVDPETAHTLATKLFTKFGAKTIAPTSLLDACCFADTKKCIVCEAPCGTEADGSVMEESEYGSEFGGPGDDNDAVLYWLDLKRTYCARHANRQGPF